MGVRVKEAGESEGPPVMGGIGVQTLPYPVGYGGRMGDVAELFGLETTAEMIPPVLPNFPVQVMGPPLQS